MSEGVGVRVRVGVRVKVAVSVMVGVGESGGVTVTSSEADSVCWMSGCVGVPIPAIVGVLVSSRRGVIVGGGRVSSLIKRGASEVGAADSSETHAANRNTTNKMPTYFMNYIDPP